MTENERRLAHMIVNLEKHVAVACEYMKTNFDVDSQYDAATTTLRLYVKNVNNAFRLLAARGYLEREHLVLFCMLDSSRNDNDNE